MKSSMMAKRNLNTEMKLMDIKLLKKEYHESKLAVAILNHPEHFNAVHKVSAAIVRLMHLNEKKIIEVIDRNESIVKELKHPFFGSVYTENDKPQAKEVFDKMRDILGDTKLNLQYALQMHCIFCYRMYEHVISHSEKNVMKKLTQMLKTDNSLLEGSRYIKKENVKGVLCTTQLGFCKNTLFARRVGQSANTHARAMDKQSVNPQSPFFQSLSDRTIPLVSGPSGHTASLIIGVKQYGNLNDEEFKEYMLAVFGFLAAGGNHSFHEVMTIANRVGMAYQPGQYTDCLSALDKYTLNKL